jgi:hypothetical protein
MLTEPEHYGGNLIMHDIVIAFQASRYLLRTKGSSEPTILRSLVQQLPRHHHHKLFFAWGDCAAQIQRVGEVVLQFVTQPETVGLSSEACRTRITAMEIRESDAM